MGLFDFFRKKKQINPLDALFNSPAFQAQREMFEKMSAENALQGCQTDEIPGGYGEFGHVPTNPIPTNTPIGSNLYLNGLRTLDGYRVNHKRLGPLEVENIDKVIDEYLITDGDGNELAVIYISPYQARNSRKAPIGFKQVSPLL